MRIDSKLNEDWAVKTVASYTDVDQSGSSSLEEEDYKKDPQKNCYRDDIGFRKVEAVRLSAEFRYQTNEHQLFTITPFYRDNQMVMMPSWMITYDPNVRDYQFQSYGAMLKFRQNLANGRGQFIVGLDTDYTPSSYEERKLPLLKSAIFTHPTRTPEALTTILRRTKPPSPPTSTPSGS